MTALRKTKKIKGAFGPRPFTTDYAGAWQGHCKTRESAGRAALKHCLEDGYTAFTISQGAVAVAWGRVSPDRKTVTVTYARPLLKGLLRRVK